MSIFGEEGLKADVQISLAPKTYVELGATIFLAAVGASLVIYAIKKLTGKQMATGGPITTGVPAV